MSDVNLGGFGIDKRELDGYQGPLSPKYHPEEKTFKSTFTLADQLLYLLALADKNPDQNKFEYREQQLN